jgi:polysaccharide pyruvyl transferase WcaK-like protein
MRIGIVYGHASGNLGDLAINHGTAGLICRVVPDAEVHVVLRNPSKDYLDAAKAGFKEIEHLSVGVLRTHSTQDADVSSDYAELVRAVEYVLDPARFIADAGLSGCDVVLYNSGEHLFAYEDRGNHIELVWCTLPALAAKAVGMRFVTLPVTAGPFKSPALAGLLRAFFALNDAIAVREPISASFAAQFLNGPPPPVLLDPAFFVSVPQQSDSNGEATLGLVMRLETWGLRAVKKLSFRAFAEHIAVYKEKGFGNSLSFRFTLAAARSFLNEVGGSRVNLIIANRPADVDLTLAVAQALTEQGYGDRLRVVQPASVSEYQEELGRASFIVASRFHACILGLLSGRPVMGVHFEQHGHKIPGLFDILGIANYCQNLSRTLPESVAASVVPLFLERDHAFAEMSGRLQAKQEDTLEWLRQVLALPKDEAPPKDVPSLSLVYIRGIEGVRSQIVATELNTAREQAEQLKSEQESLAAQLTNTREQAEQLKSEQESLAAQLTNTREQAEQLKSELAKEKRTLQAVRNSVSFQLGNLLIQAIRKRGRKTNHPFEESRRSTRLFEV